ncbi:MAG: AsnC family transcriptional regulator [Candidatus Micrarchaeota archaeon]|nr:AsnC family transcriptional regulator [Candidatus Micrarchaeota archaeon]
MKRGPSTKPVPRAVLERYEGLKRSYSFPISLKRIKGHYYIYKQLISWDRELKKYRSVEMQYLGSISSTGEFRARRLKGDDIESAKAVISAHGGTVTMPEQAAPHAEGRSRITETDRRILTELTMDGRARVPEIASRLGLDQKAASYRIRALEKRFGIVYRPKVEVEGLGYLYFVVFVKFTSSRPDLDALEKEISANPSIQFAALSPDSKYDMVLIVATISNYNSHDPTDEESLPAILRNIRMGPSLRDVEAEWYASYFDVAKGFVPLRQAFIEKLKRSSVWTARQERGPSKLSKNEYAVLEALNNDGAESFRSIERRNGMADGTARYSYDRMSGRNVVRGITICMGGVGSLYNALLIMEVIDEKAYAATRREAWAIELSERPDHLVNKITLAANIGAPYGALFMAPVFAEGDLDALQNEFYSRVKGVRISIMVLTKILCGTVPYNRFDNTKSLRYERFMASKTQEKGQT